MIESGSLSSRTQVGTTQLDLNKALLLSFLSILALSFSCRATTWPPWHNLSVTATASSPCSIGEAGYRIADLQPELEGIGDPACWALAWRPPGPSLLGTRTAPAAAASCQMDGTRLALRKVTKSQSATCIAAAVLLVDGLRRLWTHHDPEDSMHTIMCFYFLFFSHCKGSQLVQIDLRRHGMFRVRRHRSSNCDSESLSKNICRMYRTFV
ncbi:hypothetical protein NL676_014779 [Syzygium grande]|nr:hypothetical protein NL676_014779 [Syzygium grande]